MSIEWVPNNSQYCQGEHAKLGKWIVGEVFYDGSVSRGDNKVHKAKCRLPGIKNTLGNFETNQEAMQKVEDAVEYWIRYADII